jgi:hypothetical protein
MGGSDKPYDVELNKSYVFFLNNDKDRSSFHLVSYSQGIYEKEKDYFYNKKSDRKLEKNKLIEKINKL